MAGKRGDTGGGDESPLQRNIKAELERTGLTAHSLAMAAELNLTAIRDILRGKSRNPQYDTMVAIARVLGRQPADLTADTLPPLRAEGTAADGPGDVIKDDIEADEVALLTFWRRLSRADKSRMIREIIKLAERSGIALP